MAAPHSWTMRNLETQGYCLSSAEAERLRVALRFSPNPRRRRHAFKAGAVWLLSVGALLAAGQPGALLAAGQPGAALAAGVPMLVACAAVTTVNFCVPSTILRLLEERRGKEKGCLIQPKTRS